MVIDVGQERVADAIPLNDHFFVLEDPTAKLDLAQVMARGDAGFKAGTELNAERGFDFTRSAYWLRLRLKNSSDRPVERMLEIFYARMNHLTLYSPTATGNHQAVATGSIHPMSSRPHANRHFVFPVILPAHSEQVFYLRGQTNSPFLMPAVLWEPRAFYRHERNDYLVQALYFGIALAMVLFNFLLFIALRDSIYLLYVAFVVALSFALADQNGLVREFLMPASPHWPEFSTDTGYSLAAAALLFFMRPVLNTAQVLPAVDRFMKAYAVFFLMTPLAFAFNYAAVAPPMSVVYALTMPLLLGIGLAAALKRQRGAYFFLGAFSMLLLSGLIVTLRSWGVLPHSILTTYSMQIGSACEMLLLAFALADRFNMIRRERAKAQRDALQAQQQLVDSLKSSERVLEQRVAERTAELEANNLTLANTLHDLQTTQTQLIQSEKMASLGQLVANVAHEINTPIGAVKSSGRNIADALDHALDAFPRLFRILDEADRERFMQLIQNGKNGGDMPSTREERALTRELTRQLEAAGIADARQKAGILIQLHVRDPAGVLSLLRHEESAFILETAHNVASIINNTGNINTAVDRVAKIIFALKSFSRIDNSGDMQEARLQDGIETVLTIYHNQIRQGTELVRQIDDLPPIICFPDELNQVWTNLIHNALQAMHHQGTLTIALRRIGDDAVVSISDTGGGIPEAIRDRIFDPFFTTKPAGEGSGLGLDIVRKIVEKHAGRVTFESTIGTGTTFFVHLPIQGRPA